MKRFNLVCIHGNSQDPSVFDQLHVPGCEKVLVTLPGHGGRKIGAVKSFHDLVEAVHRDVHHLDNVVFVGLSLGGHVAHHLLARMAPEAIFSIAAPPLTDLASVPKAFDPHPFLGYLFQNSINEIQANELARSMLRDHHPEIKSLADIILGTTPEIRGIIGASLTRGEFLNEVDLLRQYRGRKVLVYPTLDNFISEAYIKSLNIAPVKEISGCHVLSMDNPRALADFIRMVLFAA